MEMNEIPVLLLTGYLGSGKTTLVNRILANEQGIKFAVIVNDIGEVNIDASLIEQGGVVGKSDDSLVALQNGCICCTLKMDLVQQLHEITSQRRFDYIVIEASGICEPEPIAQTICSMPGMDASYSTGGFPRLDCIVTVVDALRMQSEFQCGASLQRDGIGEEDIENLVIQQIEFCNKILINKASEVTPDELERVKQIVRAIQPVAEIIVCDYGEIDLGKILNTRLFDFDRTLMSSTWMKEIDAEHREDEHRHHDHEKHHHHHEHEQGEVEEYGISTYVYYRRPAFNLNKFDEFVARRWPKDVIRAKGLCYFSEDDRQCLLFEQAGVQKTIKDAGQWYATMPEGELAEFMRRNPDLARDWDERYGDRMQKIVFIGQHLDKEALARALDECLEYTF